MAAPIPSTGADEHWYVLRYFVGRRHRPGSGGPHPGWSIGGSGSCHGAWKARAVRLVDVLLGASVGLLFSQVLFTSNPFSDIGRSTSDFLRQIGNGLDRMLRACEVQSSKEQRPL